MKSGLFLMCSIICGLIIASVETTTIKIKNNRKINVRNTRSVINAAQPDSVLNSGPSGKDNSYYELTETTENELDHEKFMIPKTLKPADSIEVQGNLSLDRRWITVSLVMHNNTIDSPDFDNVACRMRVNFPRTQNVDNDVTIHAVVEGEHQTPKLADINALEAFRGTDGMHFDFTIVFAILESNNIELSLNGVTSLENCILHESHDLNDIRYLTLGGHIHKVDEISFVLA